MKVFVSYSRDSEAIARAVAADLGSLGHEVWIDHQLSGGQAWWDQILAAIRDCGLFVFLLHPRSLDSLACTRERAYALALGKPILPLQVADGVAVTLLPPELALRQIIPYRGADRAEVLALARAVSMVPPAPALPQPLPEPPEPPASPLAALARLIDAAATLGHPEQAAVLADLRKALREPASRADAELLLGRLRQRHDLLAAIAAEIDGLRASLPPPAPAASPAGVRRHAAGPSVAVGAGLGLVTAIFHVANRASVRAEEGLVVVVLAAAAGLIAGMLAGRDRDLQRAAVGGGLLGLCVRAVLGWQHDDWHLALLYCLGLGAIGGAVAARLWRRVQPG